jgi:hypothetical protein
LETARRPDFGAYRFKQGIAVLALVWGFVSAHVL